MKPLCIPLLLPFFSLLALQACETGDSYEGATLYYGFDELDPATKVRVADAWLIVRDGKIIDKGAGTAPGASFSNRYDMTGTYALPGLIDAHAHLTSGYHQVAIVDGAPQISIESVDEITRFHAKVALGFGVTTIRNPGSDPEASARYDQKIVSGEWDGPEALHAGAVIQPAPFVGGSFAHPQTDQEWDIEARRQAELGMTYFKLYTSLSEEELAKGVMAANAHGLTPIAHLDRVSWTYAAKVGVKTLEHALPTSPDLIEPDKRDLYLEGYDLSSKSTYQWFEMADFDGPLFTELVEALVENEVSLNLTLTVNDIIYTTNDLSKTYTEEVRTYMHPKALAGALQFLGASGYGWTEEDYDRAEASWVKLNDFTRRLHAAGVPMMIGTDGNGGGPFLAHEMQLHVDAGLSPWDVLYMATTGTAKTLGLAEMTGALKPGLEADIVFLKEDPLKDMMAIKQVSHVVNNGVLHDADGLRKEALALLE